MRVPEQFGIEFRLAAQPKAKADRVDDEGEEHRDVGYEEGDRPGNIRAAWAAMPGKAPGRAPYPDGRIRLMRPGSRPRDAAH